MSETPDGLDLTAAQEEQLWAQAEPLFVQLKQSPEENAMWIPDLRTDIGWLAGAVVAVASISPAQAVDNYALGVCRTASPSAGEEIRPTYAADSYLVYYHRGDPRYKNFSFDSDDTKVTLIKAPKHGKLVVEEGLRSRKTDYHYWPEKDHGQDRFVMQVEKDGVKVRIHYLIKMEGDVENLLGPNACDPGRWKISATTPTLDNANLAALLAGAGQNLSFADFTGSAVGQATGTGPDAQITLDNNAAGYNWFIDQTPGLNEEFLPTSNPNEWIAKAGTDAAGKMDLLSVLLHEYGHALGIEHSANSNDYMSATLQPGIRRLPSSEELALMAKLVGEIKTAQDNTPNTPINPSLPIGAGLSALLVGRLRRTDYGSWSPLFDSAKIPAPAPQFEIAANPKLQNPDFNNGTDWTTEGAVAFESGAATLTETAATQTRLNQVFVLGEHDRFLSFTLKSDLQANESAPLPNPLPQGGEGANGAAGGSGLSPSDAFEVALLDANTGHSLMGTTGLTHSDAILNLQANGSEHKATGITRIDNPDGSHTYLVDLAGIAAGTTANLAFDLIGFGLGAEAANSQITVRDLRLGVPQTTDDSATLAEDTPTVIDALANDLNARQPGFVPVVVSGPAHGQVEVNADGSFSFTPEQDWYGQDTFTYKLSDGRVDSNLATVTLTVTPVNDAPTAGDQSLTTTEDTPLTSSLLTAAADIDSALLIGSIVAGPQHG